MQHARNDVERPHHVEQRAFESYEAEIHYRLLRRRRGSDLGSRGSVEMVNRVCVLGEIPDITRESCLNSYS
jgi:hypothetical protein